MKRFQIFVPLYDKHNTDMLTPFQTADQKELLLHTTCA